MSFVARTFMVVAAALVTAAALITVGPASADTEEPRHTIVERLGEIEIRQYGTRLAADVIVTGDEEDARSNGFRLLADYIFGNNSKKSDIAMTAPVATQSARSEKI
ncbi:MAG: SOUL family heme-binding protein, partial [Alphaproteobacteria bacterium]